MADATKRMNYFDRQFLRAADFQDEQTYDLDRRRRHNRLLHTPGVAEGLQVTGNVGDASVSVAAGTAYDGLGQEIVLPGAQQVTVSSISGATATAYITISYSELASDPSTDPGVTGNSTRTSEVPALAAGSAPPAAPNLNILLAKVALANGKVAAPPDNTVETRAGTVLPTDLALHSLTLTNNTIAPAGDPKLTCDQANYAALHNASLAMDAQTEIVFQDNGQIRSFDQNHKLLFNRANNLMELHELGDILLATGAPSQTEKMRVTAGGNVGIGTATPDRPLTVQGNAGTYLNVRDKGDAGGPYEVLLGADTGGGIVSTMTNHDLQLRSGGNVTQVTIKANGNVGLGTNTPRSDLEVQTAGPSKLGPSVTLTNPSGGGGAGCSMDFNTYTPATTGTYNPTSRIEAVDDNDWSNSIVFLTNKPGAANNGLVERMRVTANLGDYVMDVTGRIRLRQGVFASAGLWLFQTTPNADRAFVGMATDTQVGFWGNTGAQWGLVMDITTGNVGMGIQTAAPAAKLDVGGSVHASAFPTSSDERFKTNVQPLTNVLEKLVKVRGVTFEWNELYESMGRSTHRREIGVIAQELEPNFPELVSTWDAEGHRAVDYGRMTAVLLEAVKELKAQNDALQARIEKLEKTDGVPARSKRARTGETGSGEGKVTDAE
jgi:hypothetical protein